MSVTDTAPAAESPEIATEVFKRGEPLAIDQFIAGVLRRAHQTVEPLRAPSEARTILRVAHLFADDLEQTDLPFDRLPFIEAVMEDPRHA
jgi:broad specificity phosphatase PhoE